MGITGLLPFVKRATRPASVREFCGATAAVDAYCWLHRGAFACAGQLARGERTDVHINYCMKLVNMLLHHGLKPILVFDGCNLPSKAGTEARRRESRQKYRALAVDHLRAGRDKEAQECFQRCVDITPDMARTLIRACRARGVDCVVAPYEADAQLAFLSQSGIADLIITEDSDLLLFGCTRILFKMDISGSGRLVCADQLPLVLGNSADKFSLERLRMVCILSGCDYLSSLPGIGLGRASKLFLKAAGAADSEAVLNKLPTYLNMKQLVVPKEYKEDFVKAENTFLYQLVFDPVSRKLRPLTPYPPGKCTTDFPYAGEWMDHETAMQCALGNICIKTGGVVDSFNPDKRGSQAAHASHRSIWARDYVVSRRTWSQEASVAVTRSGTAGKTAQLSVMEGLKKAAEAAVAAAADRNEQERRQVEADIAAMYGVPLPQASEEDNTSQDSRTKDSSQDSGLPNCEVIDLNDFDDGLTDSDLNALFASVEPSEIITPEVGKSPDEVRSPHKSGAPQATAQDEESPEVGSARSRNPFRVRGALRDKLSGAKRRLCASGDGLTKIVTSQYFKRSASSAEPTGTHEEQTSPAGGEVPDALREPVQSMEEFLKRRRHSSSSNLHDSSPKRTRRSLSPNESPPSGSTAGGSRYPVPHLPRLSTASACGDTSDSWYKISSVFDPKHAMTVWDSEMHGLRKPVRSTTPPPRQPGKENSPSKHTPAVVVSAPKRFLGQSAPAATVDSPTGPSSTTRGHPGARSRSMRVKTTPCRKVGLSKPASGRQLNLKQMFAYKKPDAPRLHL